MPQFNSPSRTADRRLSLVLPQLLDAGPVLLDSLRYRAPDLPALATLLARGHWRDEGSTLPFVDETGLAPAPLALLGEGGSPGDACWLRADPVHLLPDQDHLLLWDAAALSLSGEEADALVDAFDRHFADDGYHLRVGAPGRWYLRSDRDLRGETTPVIAVSGKNPFHFMPTGADREALEQLINETQMLFHEHPVNSQRRAEGRLTVSGIWPWGGGRLEAAPDAVAVDRVFAGEPLYRGLGQWLQRPVDAPQACFAAWQKETARGHDLVVLTAGSDAARLGEETEWHAALVQLERDWWAPMAAALWRGRLSALQLYFGATGSLVLDPWRMRRIWRRPKSLASLLQAREGVNG